MKRKDCKAGQVWWAQLEPTVGSEQRGLRPVYVAHKFDEHLLWAFPLTTKKKTGSWYIPFLLEGQEAPTSSVILSQSRTIDSKRLVRKIGKANIQEYHKISKAFYKLTNIKKYGGDCSPPRNLKG